VSYFNKNIFLVITLLAVLLSSCVDDGAVSFPDEDPEDISTSISLVTVLRNFDQNGIITSQSDQCFSFTYPVTFSYNTDATISVDDYDGLVGVISSQSSNFNITGLQLPIDVTFNGSGINTRVLDENDFLETSRYLFWFL